VLTPTSHTRAAPAGSVPKPFSRTVVIRLEASQVHVFAGQLRHLNRVKLLHALQDVRNRVEMLTTRRLRDLVH
jgi:hypothetical protein